MICACVDVEWLWDYVLDGMIDLFGFDYLLYTIEEKQVVGDDIFKVLLGLNVI